MIPMLSSLLNGLFKLPFFQDRKTLFAAIGLFGLCIYMLSAGQTEAGVTNFIVALGLLGIRLKWTPAVPVPPDAASDASPATRPPISLPELLDLAEAHDQLRDPDAEKAQVVFGSAIASIMKSTSPNERRERRQSRREQVIVGLSKAGVSRFSIAVWMPIILALLDVTPQIIDVIKQIIAAIQSRKTPVEFAKEKGIIFSSKSE